MFLTQHFASDYADARARFRAAADVAGARVTSFQNPLRGPTGERLFADCAWVGPAEAGRVLVSLSATHGVEGFCGSGCQTAWLAEGLARELPPDTAALAVHAINPHGFAWLRRVTEDNVDLNRNFLDHARPTPVNPAYDELAAAICPPAWTQAARTEAQARLDAYAAHNGLKALQAAFSQGQYRHPDGLFFGGHAPTWSNRTLARIFATLLPRARHIGVLDFHTGLGPYGVGELIAIGNPGTATFDRLQGWFDNQVTSPELGTSSSAVLTGANQPAMMAFAAPATCTCVALEYGTSPLAEVLAALRADNWLHWHGDLAGPEAHAIKAEMRRVFYPDRDDWRDLVWARALEVTRQMLAGLAGA
ncbi:MAG: M14 family metallopeptidase [Pseudomonadota bacterium]